MKMMTTFKAVVCCIYNIILSGVLFMNKYDCKFEHTLPLAGTGWETIRLWPGGIIPYNLPEGMYEPDMKGLILSAMRRWETKTCVKFVPWTEELERKYGEIRFINFFSAGNCFSRNGYHNLQPQLIGIGKGCLSMSTVVHELGHAIGLVHEMSRVDRNHYVTIHVENINPSSLQNYHTTDDQKIKYRLFGTPYDYKSIMHYGPKAWSASGLPVVTTNDPAYQDIIGKARDVSFFDALYVNRAYNCSKSCSQSATNSCKNGGFTGGSDCHCICQDGFAGEECEIALPGYDKIVDWQCQKGWEFYAGRCYKFVKRSETYDAAIKHCNKEDSSLPVTKTKHRRAWLSQMVKEQTARFSKVSSFWIGMARNNGTLQWTDGSIVDSNLTNIRNEVPRFSTKACGRHDGSHFSLSDCGLIDKNGFICVKDFDANCGGRYVLEKKGKFIQSPGFPRGYPDNIKCHYVLQSPENTYIKIEFHNFSLEEVCNKDYLEVKTDSDVSKAGQRHGISL